MHVILYSQVLSKGLLYASIKRYLTQLLWISIRMCLLSQTIHLWRMFTVYTVSIRNLASSWTCIPFGWGKDRNCLLNVTSRPASNIPIVHFCFLWSTMATFHCLKTECRSRKVLFNNIGWVWCRFAKKALEKDCTFPMTFLSNQKIRRPLLSGTRVTFSVRKPAYTLSLRRSLYFHSKSFST